jgi:solute carrier family 35 protein E1
MASASPIDSNPHATFKFPAFQPDLLPTYEEDEEPFGISSSRTASPNGAAQTNGHALPSERWQPRRENKYGHLNGSAPKAHAGHGRQKSLGEALQTIRTRKASVSQNAHEIADALKAPVSGKLVVRTHLAETEV